MLTLKESVRWLTVQGRHEEAWDSLKWIRADNSEGTELEMDEIRVGVEWEAHAKEGFKLTGMPEHNACLWISSRRLDGQSLTTSAELFDRHNFRRTVTAAAVFTAQQATGATAFAYYGPQYVLTPAQIRIQYADTGSSDSSNSWSATKAQPLSS